MIQFRQYDEEPYKKYHPSRQKTSEVSGYIQTTANITILELSGIYKYFRYIRKIKRIPKLQYNETPVIICSYDSYDIIDCILRS